MPSKYMYTWKLYSDLRRLITLVYKVFRLVILLDHFQDHLIKTLKLYNSPFKARKRRDMRGTVRITEHYATALKGGQKMPR